MEIQMLTGLQGVQGFWKSFALVFMICMLQRFAFYLPHFTPCVTLVSVVIGSCATQ